MRTWGITIVKHLLIVTQSENKDYARFSRDFWKVAKKHESGINVPSWTSNFTWRISPNIPENSKVSPLCKASFKNAVFARSQGYKIHDRRISSAFLSGWDEVAPSSSPSYCSLSIIYQMDCCCSTLPLLTLASTFNCQLLGDVWIA